MSGYSLLLKGFTLLELMMTIAIAAIVLTMAIPSFTGTIKGDRLTTRTNELVSMLNFSRSEAIKRGVRVTVCKSANPIAATPICSSDNSITWSSGWIVFTDQNDNASYNSATETLLKVQQNQVGNIAMTGTANISNYISFVASGQSRLVNNNPQSGTIKVCDDRIGNVGVVIAVNNAGRVSTLREIACP